MKSLYQNPWKIQIKIKFLTEIAIIPWGFGVLGYGFSVSLSMIVYLI